jgi:hypothetical protein
MRRRLLAVALTVTLALSAHTAWRDYSERQALSEPASERARTFKTVAGPLKNLPARLSDAGGERQSLSDSSIDPFKPVSFLPPPPVVVASVAAPVPPIEQPKPVAPAFPYKFFGRMVTIDGVSMTFFSKDGSLTPISKGTVLDNVYRVDQIDEKKIAVTYLPLNETVIVFSRTAGE